MLKYIFWFISVRSRQYNLDTLKNVTKNKLIIKFELKKYNLKIIIDL